ncbi:hypothetical protein M406DRAFT_322631 [Cryphonectria parasitica EP155]|uniref:MARVEL domain-containing protein n=1 Tax=Cryphonectria parasitica (strain ATCC 38755 / EP155) TaxID=660469 RepID=A0A9P4Y0W3_CRYP1|nr:uncharacterized protein M406DRAFT_322631 [Cryphonectria parasitica EP155]KAF3764501.1 hypothetical protein M406DRAFT_322631 [Cryphonectria parasitica EP155]
MSSKYSNVRSSGREHIPLYPKGFIALRIVQLILSVVVLGLDAYALSILSFDATQLNIFTALWTMIIGIYYLVVEVGGHSAWKGYNYWAVLTLDIFSLIFWLVSFALMAARVAPFANGFEVCGVLYCDYEPLEGEWLTLFASMAAVAGLGGVEFILFIVSLSIHSVVLHRHRDAGLHCSPGDVPQQQQQQQNAIPMGGPVPAAEKPQPQYAAASAQPSVATPTPPPGMQGPYHPPEMAGQHQHQQQQGYYGQQQVVQQGHGQVGHGGAFPAPQQGGY